MFQLYDYILLFFIIIAFVWNVRFHKLSKILMVLGALSGLLTYGILNGFTGLLFSVVGMVVGAAVGLILYYVKAFDLEDVALFAVIGSFLGLVSILYLALYTIFFALIIGAIVLATTRITMMNKIWNKCMERVYMFTSKKHKPIVLQLEKATVSFSIMYAVLPAIIVYYITIA